MDAAIHREPAPRRRDRVVGGGGGFGNPPHESQAGARWIRQFTSQAGGGATARVWRFAAAGRSPGQPRDADLLPFLQWRCNDQEHCHDNSPRSADQDSAGRRRAAAIMNALASSFREVVLLPGTFYINSTITLPENCTLRGCGAATRAHPATGITGAMFAFTTPGNNFTIRDLQIDGSTISATPDQLAERRVGQPREQRELNQPWRADGRRHPPTDGDRSPERLPASGATRAGEPAQPVNWVNILVKSSEAWLISEHCDSELALPAHG